MARNAEEHGFGNLGDDDGDIPGEVDVEHFDRRRRNDILGFGNDRGYAGARGFGRHRVGGFGGESFPDDEMGFGERPQQRQRRQHLLKQVHLTPNQRENTQMELQIDEFNDSPQFTTTLLIEYNRGYKRIGFKLQPVYAGWESVNVQIIKRNDSHRLYDHRMTTNLVQTKMEKIDNGDALYAAIPTPERGDTWLAEFRFSTSPPERREREGQSAADLVPSSSNEDCRNFQAAKMYMDEKYSDFTFICEYPGEETLRIPVHKVIVGPCSPYFQGMFLGDNKERQKNEALVNTFKPGIVKEIFFYIYHGKVSNQACSICSEVVKAADYFQLDGLRDHCLTQVGKNIDRTNILDLICLAGQFGGQDIAIRAKQFIETYMTKDETEQLYSNLIKNNPEAAIHFFANT